MYSWLQQGEISAPRSPSLIPPLPLRVHEGPVRRIPVDQAFHSLVSDRVAVEDNQMRSMLIIRFLGRTGETLLCRLELDYSAADRKVEDTDLWNAQSYIHQFYHQSNRRLAWSQLHAAMQIYMGRMVANHQLRLFCRTTPDKDTYAYVLQLAGGKTYLFSVVEVTQDQAEQFYFDTETPEWGNNEDISAEWFGERYGRTFVRANDSAWSLPRYDHSRRDEPWMQNVKHKYAIVDFDLQQICSCIQSKLRALLPAFIYPADPG